MGRGIRRPATASEVEAAQPFHQPGSGDLARVGILMIHGFTATPAALRGYAERLAADGFTLSVPTLPGHARTPEDLCSVSYDDWIEACVKAYDRLRAECDTVHVIGISLGGALSLDLSTQRTEIRKLFLLAPAVYPLPILTFCRILVFPVLELFGVRFWKGLAGDMKKEGSFEIAYGRTSLNGLRQLERGMRLVQRKLPDVRADVLIFQGTVDHDLPPHRASTILEKLGSANKELVWLENSYHEISRDHDAEAVIERIRAEILAAAESS